VISFGKAKIGEADLVDAQQFAEWSLSNDRSWRKAAIQ
jgi:hypothetical protein